MYLSTIKELIICSLIIGRESMKKTFEIGRDLFTPGACLARLMREETRCRASIESIYENKKTSSTMVFAYLIVEPTTAQQFSLRYL